MSAPRLSQMQKDVLERLSPTFSKRPDPIAEALERPREGIVATCASLCRHGLAVRIRGQRGVEYFRTPAGTTVVDKLRAAR